MNMMVHFPLSDASGRSVVVEYVNNEMKVTETQAVTNFYLTEGEKYGIRPPSLMRDMRFCSRHLLNRKV